MIFWSKYTMLKAKMKITTQRKSATEKQQPHRNVKICELSNPRCERYLPFFLLFSRPTLKIDQKIRDILTKQIKVVVQSKYWLLYLKRIGKPPIPSKWKNKKKNHVNRLLFWTHLRQYFFFLCVVQWLIVKILIIIHRNLRHMLCLKFFLWLH